MLTRLREHNIAASKLNGFALLLRSLLAVGKAGRYSTEVEPECYLLAGRPPREVVGGSIHITTNIVEFTRSKENFANIRGLVLGCIEADVCN